MAFPIGLAFLRATNPEPSDDEPDEDGGEDTPHALRRMDNA